MKKIVVFAVPLLQQLFEQCMIPVNLRQIGIEHHLYPADGVYPRSIIPPFLVLGVKLCTWPFSRRLYRALYRVLSP